jgi:hypothetical protein
MSRKKSAAGNSLDVRLWLWVKRRILQHEAVLSALMDCPDVESLVDSAKTSFGLLIPFAMSPSLRGTARKRWGPSASRMLQLAVFRNVAEFKALRDSHGIGLSVDSKCGLSLVATRDLAFAAHETVPVRGTLAPLRGADIIGAAAGEGLDSWMALSSCDRRERLLHGPLSLAAHSCVPLFDAVTVTACVGTYAFCSRDDAS